MKAIVVGSSPAASRARSASRSRATTSPCRETRQSPAVAHYVFETGTASPSTPVRRSSPHRSSSRSCSRSRDAGSVRAALPDRPVLRDPASHDGERFPDTGDASDACAPGRASQPEDVAGYRDVHGEEPRDLRRTSSGSAASFHDPWTMVEPSRASSASEATKRPRPGEEEHPQRSCARCHFVPPAAGRRRSATRARDLRADLLPRAPVGACTSPRAAWAQWCAAWSSCSRTSAARSGCRARSSASWWRTSACAAIARHPGGEGDRGGPRGLQLRRELDLPENDRARAPAADLK